MHPLNSPEVMIADAANRSTIRGTSKTRRQNSSFANYSNGSLPGPSAWKFLAHPLGEAGYARGSVQLPAQNRDREERLRAETPCQS